MTKAPYDDDVALAEYISLYSKHFMSEVEQRNMRLCAEIYRIESSQQNEFDDIRERANEAARAFWKREFDPELMSALHMGFVEYREQLHKRFILKAKEGKLPINRCPTCNRIVRTPLAKQCRWCGFDWHA